MRYYKFMWRKYLRKLLNIKGNPSQIAMGFALGIFIGFTPTFGFQMALILAINTMVGVNKIAGIIAVQVSNFFTAIPMYVFNYWVGSLVWVNATPLTTERLKDVMSQGFFRCESFSDWGFNREAGKVWLDFMIDMGGPLWLGSIIMGIIMALLSYKPTLWAVEKYRKAKEQRRHQRHLRIMAHKKKSLQ